VLKASAKLGEKQRWKAVELLRHWSGGKQFGGDKDQAREELDAWVLWFGQTFPKEPTIVRAGATAGPASKYDFKELLNYLEKDPVGAKGDPVKGKLVFTKAQCVKCHKYGSEGEGIGPDLTTLSKRFKRSDTLESLLYPSKVIADQYRSVTIVTKKGQQIMGIAAPVGDTVTVVLNDATKVTLRKDEIEAQYASLVSVMPEKLIDELTREEIADLFAFLESEPAK
jgi:putative heme-binding domain-containing protein